MEYPLLPVRQTSRQLLDAFLGYRRSLRPGLGEFSDMENLTGDLYPVLSPRKPRAVFARPESPQGLLAKDGLCYVDGSAFVINGHRTELSLSTAPEDCPKELVSMGAYVIILPDKKWINTLDLSDFGQIEAVFESKNDVSVTLCNAAGEDYGSFLLGEVPPESPENSDLWMDTSESPHVLKKYAAATELWVSIPSTCVKLHSPGIGMAFSVFDGVTIQGLLRPDLQSLNGSHPIWAKGDDYIVLSGTLDAPALQTAAEGALTVSRRMPKLDFVTESGNRLWGCRCGLAENGQVVNEIYASKLGDFKNWNCYLGLSTDSYAASCGSDGAFTGAVTHLGYPLFFKEGCVHKVYGSCPANFQIQTTTLRGVQSGCAKSLAIVDEVLYYKSPSGVCAYDGSLPQSISEALGTEPYDQAAAGSLGSKYYLSMRNAATGVFSLFVYDTRRRLWHKEDGFPISQLCACREELYALSGNTIHALLGTRGQLQTPVSWYAVTGELGLSSPDTKYISRLTLRLSLDPGAKLKVFAGYDFSSGWECLGSLRGTDLRSFSLPLRPRRCDRLTLKFEGLGGCKIYSLALTWEEGGENP